MSFIYVTYKTDPDTPQLVDVSEAIRAKENNELVIPDDDGKALTLAEFYGSSYEDDTGN